MAKDKKTINNSLHIFKISTPKNRKSSFEPKLIKNQQTTLAENLSEKIINLYGLGMSLQDISAYIKEMYDSNISHTVLNQITDKIIPDIKAWQRRVLEPIYCIIWLDTIHYKVKKKEKTTHKAIYNILGVNKKGKKEILGIYISENKETNFWLQVLMDLSHRGLKDILIACTDNLKEFNQAILSIYPKTKIQKCIVHQIRNSLKYITSKDQKEFLKNLKLVYKAINKSVAEEQLFILTEKWGEKYPIVIKSWNNNWEELSAYFEYTTPIRKVIYTTSILEEYQQVRKVTKTKEIFLNDMALLKLAYLVTKNIEKKWTSPLQNWNLTIQQFHIKFGNRISLDIQTQKNSTLKLILKTIRFFKHYPVKCVKFKS